MQEICETIEASSVRDSRTQRQESSSGPRQRSEDQTTRKISDSDARSRKVSESSQVNKETGEEYKGVHNCHLELLLGWHLYGIFA